MAASNAAEARGPIGPEAGQAGAAEHRLKLVDGVAVLSIVPTAECLHVGIRGARPRGFERLKFNRWARPIFDGLLSDPRGIEFTGEGLPFVGHIRRLPDGRYIGYQAPLPGATQ